jgi:3-oxoacyl-[acyl-carrier protein] reductase
MGTLNRKRALVTGAGQGLGTAIAEHLLAAGADVALHYFSSEAGARAVKAEGEKRGRRVEIFRADLTREAEASALANQAADFLGGLDILINNTGDLIQRRALAEVDLQFWQRVIDVNVTSMMLVTRASLPWLLQARQASIVNLSSLAGRKGGHPGSLVYSTAKGAILTWTRSLATELAPQGVRVNAVAPGFILGTRFHQTHTTADSAEATVRQIPLGRAGNPADVARAVAFLASEYDGFITGATLDVNGGVYVA